jgi:hypothetical protein
MVDDDDPNTVPAGNEPAGNEKVTPPPVEPPADDQSDDQPEGEQAETKAEDQEELDLGEADEQEEDDDDEGEDASPQGEKSRLKRYREQTARLKAENEALRTRTGGGVPSDQAQLQRALEYAVLEKIGDPPQQKDFGDDYVAFANAKLAYEIDARQVSREVRRDFAATIKTEQDRVAGQVAEHKERVQRLRSRVKDFDEVMARATLPVAPHVERLLLASKKSDRLSYVLGKNQAKLAQLNRLAPEEAAREIGRLEGRLSLPSATRTKTQARKPITPLKGSGASPPSDTAAVNSYIKKLYGDRA